MRWPMKEIYWLIFVYDFVPEMQYRDKKYILRLTHPRGRYYTEYTLGDKIVSSGGVDPYRIFKRKKGYPR